mgnify:CR=1 FL=1|tara:strand:+ start:1081 stop:1251 length:171 start_codon:yes stop_codon:yes gene_type:complete
MDNKELYHNYSEVELCQPREVEYFWMLEIAKDKAKKKFNKKVYRKKVIIEKYLKND